MAEQPGSGTPPPSIPDALLRACLPRDITGQCIRGDLWEEHAAHLRDRGRLSADLWFWLVATRLTLGYGGRRLLEVGVRDLGRDVRHAVRSLARAPGFVALTVLTLAIGLGATTTIFSVVRSVVLKPLPFESPDEVVALRNSRLGEEGQLWSLSFPQFEDLQRETSAFVEMGGWRPWQSAWLPEDGGPPRRVVSAGTTHEVFRLLGLETALGRTFTADDEVPGRPRTAIVSHGFWRATLGSRADVIGTELVLNGESFAVLGVLPERFRGETDGGGVLPPARVDVWVPYRNSPVAEGTELRGLTNVNVVARLAPGRDVADAQADLDRVMTALRATFDEHATERVVPVPAQEVVVAGARSEMALLMGAVLLVLLLAYVNATNLILGRVDARLRELSVRRALGAGRARVLRLLLAESAVLAALGGALACGIALLGVRVLRVFDPGTLPRLASASVDPQTGGILALSIGIAVIVLGVVPAWAALRARAGHPLQAGQFSRGTRTSRLRPVLVVAQVALATVLFSGALLLTRSLREAVNVEPGFVPDQLLTARVDHPTSFVSEEWPEHVAFFRTVVEALRQAPGVVSAAAAYQDPADPGWNNSFRIVGDTEDRLYGAIFRPITPGYFETAGIPLVDGRSILETDDTQAPGVAVVNRTFAERYFPGSDALGQRLDYGDFWLSRRDREYEIVGIVQDVRFSGIEAEVPPAIYFPHAQQPIKEMAFIVRAEGDPLALVSRLRDIVTDANPTLPVFAVSSLEQKLSDGYAERRFLVLLLGGFAVVALTLAAIGLYGVLSFVVARRTQEIGVRLAIGAAPGTVRSLVLKQGMALVWLGLLIGIPAALGASRLLQGLLFQVSPADVRTHVFVPAVLALVGLLACWIPARRATRVDPLRALRAE